MATTASVLLADNQEHVLSTLGLALRRQGYEVVATTCVNEAKNLLRQRPFDVLVLDEGVPGINGLDLVRSLRQERAGTRVPHVVFMTGSPVLEAAMKWGKPGAVVCLQKPFEVSQLLAATEKALYPPLPIEEFKAHGIVGASEAVRLVLEQATLVASSMSTVLITGETGTGKELLARAIHNLSPRRNRPLVKVNCAAIPDTLLESELFGHRRGAFTGALANKRGRFAVADGGTIFLDEVGTLGPTLQPKILRVLQEREFEPLGAEHPERVDVRVIAATNRNLARMAAEGAFQVDLYYRLNVIPLHLPPLRERPEDIPALAAHFVEKHRGRGIEDAAMRLLIRYAWPGNVRELENTIERAVVLAGGGVVGPECIAVHGPMAPSAAGLPSMSLKDNVEWAERETVRRALAAVHGVKKDAAHLIGVSQRAFSYYLAKHHVD